MNSDCFWRTAVAHYLPAGAACAKLLAFVTVLFVCGFAELTRVEAATIQATSCAQSAVQAAINSAASGDTIVVPAGTCTWSSSVNVSKDISIVGAGAQSTKITRRGDCFTLNMANTTRVSGFGFTNCTISGTGAPAAGKTFRIDHNSFTSTSWQINEFNGSCQTPMRHPTGVFDNNSFYNYAVAHVDGSNCLMSEGNYQSQLWSQPPPIGNGVGIIYMEDNVIGSDPNVHQNWVDGNYGGRYVARFNTITGNTYAEIHSVQGANRAVQWWEFYKNTDTKPVANWYPFIFARGGSGMIWGNRVSSNYSNDILIDNVRSQNNPGDGVGACNGSSNWDQNTAGMIGYACRDQLGRSMDNSVWTPGTGYAQNLTPAYFWDNLKGSSQMAVVVSNSCGYSPCLNRNVLHLVQNRDWYTQNTSFTGTSGVGMGPLAQRPAVCTPGVSYWATDQGEWNSRQAGADGQLYKCTATNVWTLHYTPYQYPHPLQDQHPHLLQGGSVVPPPSDTTAPSIPANLSTTSVSTSQINLSWTASTDNVGVTGYLVERCQGASCTNFAQVATPSEASYSSTGLSAGTAYRYRLKARDAAGNLSGYSAIATGTTTSLSTDTTSPSVPTSLAASVQSSSQINLTWTASTDNLGVTGYRVERCKGSSCRNFAQIAAPAGAPYLDTGLVAKSAYRYRVRAADAAGNLSDYSSIASAKTDSAVSNKFKVGDRIILVMDTLARSTPSVFATRLGTHLTGELGTIVGGPISADGMVWWQIDYDSNPDGWSGDEERFKKKAGSADPTSPTVALTAPAAGSNVSGTITVTATASDNVGVVGVRFRLDGVNLGAEDASAPYSVSWDTTTASKGVHMLTALARDAAGNQTTSGAVSVNVTKFRTGDRIILVLDTLARSTPSVFATRLGTHLTGELGTIVGGPVAADGYTWWQIDYDKAPDGWSGDENRFEKRLISSDRTDSTLSSETAVFEIPEKGGVSWRTNPAATAETRYARVQLDASENQGAGVAILSFRTNGALISEVAIPAAPPVVSGRIPVRINNNLTTGVSFANTGSQDTVISFVFTGATGTDFNQGAFTLNAGRLFSAFLNQPPFNGSGAFEGTFTFYASAPVATAAISGFTNERGEFLITSVPVARIGLTNNGTVLPHVVDGGGWTTEVVLTNPFNVSLAGAVEFYGGERTAFEYTIPPNSSVRFTTDGLAATTTTGSARIIPSVGLAPAATAILSLRRDGVTVSQAGVEAQNPGTTFQTYAESSGNAGEVASITTRAAIANPSDSDVEVILDLIGLNGARLGTATVTVPASGHIEPSISSLLAAPAEFRGSLKVTSPSPVAVATLRGRYNERGEYLMTAIAPGNNGQREPASELIFVPLPSSDNYSTQFVTFGLPGTGKLWLYRSDGTRLSGEAIEEMR